ncbi:TipJ family phage tail tip protein, partial [Salipiger aestuarii]|uniref:TipJ family phage tail tip protein n=2 Tax=Salipiger aestuarii TaxID=568098 RepID=UPI0040562D7A
ETEKTELLNETMFRNLAHAKVMTAARADDDNSVRISGGTVQIEGVRIGDTPITEYDEIETELQTARPASDVLDLSPMQIFEEGVGAELVRDWPLDDAGNRTDGPAVDTPIRRFTGDDAAGVRIVLNWSGGLFQNNRDGELKTLYTAIRVRQRPSLDVEWEEVALLEYSEKKDYQFFRELAWTVPARGRWQIEVMRTDNPADDREMKTCRWELLQTLRPEAPVAWGGTVTKLGMRARATAQFSGQIDRLSALCSRIIPDYDAATGTWMERATSNPASAFRAALQSEALPERLRAADSAINLGRIEHWHAFCTSKGLTFNHVFEEDGLSLGDVLADLPPAGPSFMTRICRLDLGIRLPRLAHARRA